MEIKTTINHLLACTLVLSSVLCPAVDATAQTGIISQLQSNANGQAKVVVHQDARLDSIVNGLQIVPSETTTKVEKPVADTHKTTQSKVSEALSAVQNAGASARARARGYRIQVYFGGNKRADQSKAQQVGTKIQSRYPELRSYTSFESPHWRCRVGDFPTREAAAPYVRKLRSTGLCADATIVRSEIYIFE
ncbi:MAG: SPOR domain-containing protein [Prevotellaceae bacterium]|nr:SPOR domain-containing protein [Candidatus Colivivens equi]